MESYAWAKSETLVFFTSTTYLALINQGKNSISDQIKGLFFLFLYQPLSDIRDIRRRNVLVYKSFNDFPTKKNVSEVVM